MAILRLYTWTLFVPWNNALRGLNEKYEPDDTMMGKWATCIAVLFSAASGPAENPAAGPGAEAAS